MLSIFRKHATSWLIKVALFLIVIVFIFWGGYSYTERDASRLARVNDQYITISEYDKAYSQMVEMYRRQFGNRFSEELINQLNLKHQALNMLIDRYVLSEAASELGLTASEQEMQQRILEYPAFQRDGRFDQEQYVFVLRQNRLSPEVFEEQMRADLSLQNVESFIKRQAVVTEDEILAEFRFSQSPIQISYAELTANTFTEQVTSDEKVLKDYFEKHKEKYKEPEKRKFSLVVFQTDSYMKDVQVTSDEIADYYNENQAQYEQEAEVKARHILFRVNEKAPEEEVAKVEAEAQKVLAEAKSKGADFTELVKKYSQAPDAEKGGDLGYFTRDRMVPAFAEAAFALKAGEVSEVVRTQYGFHIIKVEDVRPARTIPLEEARSEIELNLKRQRAKDIAYEKARSFADLAYADGDLKKGAKQENLPLRETEDWLPEQGQIPGLSTPPDVMKDLFTLPEKGISSVLEAEQDFLVARVESIKAPEIPLFDQVKVKIDLDYKNEQSQELARKAAADLLVEAKKVNSLEQAGKEKQLEIKKSDWFSRTQPDRSLKIGGAALNKLFELSEANPFPESSLDVNNEFFLVYQLIGKKPAPQEQLEKERPNIVQTLQTQKQNQLWQSWLEQQRRKAKIEIFKEL